MTRLQKLRQMLSKEKLESLLVSTPDNRRYLSGFTGSAGYLLITSQEAILCTDFRYTQQAGQQAPEFDIHRVGPGYAWLSELCAKFKIQQLGFESGNITVAAHSLITAALKENPSSQCVFTPTNGLVEPMRAVKEPEELALISRAMEIADNAFGEVTSTIRVGETEESVAWRLEKSMREQGAEAPAFDTIVGAGPNAALPHHRADRTPITEGVPIVIDFGARYQGYNSDMTRTICIGKPDETFRVIYDTVLGAQLTASATIREGMTSGEADFIARSLIEEAGYGDKFGHSLGHGIGLAVHEEPRVGPNAEMLLIDQTVFTIEPGIYIPGWGGVRIEDTVIMDQGSVKSLTRSHKNENPYTT